MTERKLFKLTIWLKPEDVARLQQLADARSQQMKRNVTIGDCIRGFIRTCQPGGSDWTHPTKAKDDG